MIVVITKGDKSSDLISITHMVAAWYLWRHYEFRHSVAKSWERGSFSFGHRRERLEKNILFPTHPTQIICNFMNKLLAASKFIFQNLLHKSTTFIYVHVASTLSWLTLEGLFEIWCLVREYRTLLQRNIHCHVAEVI